MNQESTVRRTLFEASDTFPTDGVTPVAGEELFQGLGDVCCHFKKKLKAWCVKDKGCFKKGLDRRFLSFRMFVLLL